MKGNQNSRLDSGNVQRKHTIMKNEETKGKEEGAEGLITSINKIYSVIYLK